MIGHPFTGVAGAVMIAALALSGCGNLSKVDAQGQAASLSWPEAKQATRPEGSYPDPGHLAMIEPGMSKDQLYDLLGRPHFHEGLFMVREWDYLFHLRGSAGDELCQYKVLFDRNRTVRSVHWRTPACAAAAGRAAAGGIKAATPQPSIPR